MPEMRELYIRKREHSRKDLHFKEMRVENDAG